MDLYIWPDVRLAYAISRHCTWFINGLRGNIRRHWKCQKSAIHVIILSANLYSMLKFCILYYCKSLSIYQIKNQMNSIMHACQNKLSNKRHFAFFSLKNGIIRIFFIFCWLLVYVLSKIVIEKKLGITMLLFLTTHKAIRYFKVYFIRVHVLPHHELYVFPRLP
jgi:hypothetical protein